MLVCYGPRGLGCTGGADKLRCADGPMGFDMPVGHTSIDGPLGLDMPISSVGSDVPMGPIDVGASIDPMGFD